MLNLRACCNKVSATPENTPRQTKMIQVFDAKILASLTRFHVSAKG